MTKQELTTIALCGCGLGMLALQGCSDSATPADTRQEAPAVQVTNIIQQKVTDTKEWFGYVTGKEVTDIKPRVTGFLLEQKYTNGAFVKAGEVLFRIDSATFEALLAQAQADLQAAEATLKSAEASRDQAMRDYERFSQLIASHAISDKDFEDAELTLRSAEASVKAAKAMVEQQRAAVHKAQIDVEYCTIRAPYDGIVGTALSSIGDLVTPATKMTSITKVEPILAKFAVSSASIIDTLRTSGDLAQASGADESKIPAVELVLEDGSVFPYKGKIVTLGSTVSENGKVDMEAEFPNPSHLLRDGMPVRVRIPVAEREALLVPPSAIRKVLRNDFIIVVGTDNVPHTIPVTVSGEYEVPTPYGPQKLVAVSDFNRPLADVLKDFGYAKPSDAKVVADPESGIRAQNISAANSRKAKGEALGTVTPVEMDHTPHVPEALKAAAEKGNAQKAAPNPDAKATLPPVPVKVTKLLQQDIAVNDEWFGTLRGEDETDIRPQVSGFLLSRNFENGALVKKGDVLYEIDPAPYKAAEEQALANLHAAQATKEQIEARLEMCKKDYERNKSLQKTNPGAIEDKKVTDSETAVATTTAALEKATATVAQMEAALNLAQINLGYTRIEAPFAGRVGISNPSVGALVSPTDPLPMVRLSSENPMRVEFDVSGKGALKGIAAFQEHHAAGAESVGPQFEIILEDGSLYPARGKVVSADNALSRSTGTLKIIGQVENVDGGLRPGMPVRVRAGMDERKGSYLVPARAPLNANGMDLLILVAPDNTPQMLPITKGAIVNIPVEGPDGSTDVQPMQIIDINRQMVGEMVRAQAGNAPTLEAVVLGGAGVDSWGALLLKQSGAKDFRELIEKQAGHPLPDDAPAQAGAKDWGDLLLKQAQAKDFRQLILDKAGAKDEMDLIAQGQGFKDAMHMVLAQLGVKDSDSGCVVAEGSLMAAQIFAANQKAGAPVNKVTPVPFQYHRPQPVVPSVTADTNPPQSPQEKKNEAAAGEAAEAAIENQESDNH